MITPMVREPVLYQYVFLAAAAEDEAGHILRLTDELALRLLRPGLRHLYAWLGRPPDEAPPVLHIPSDDERRKTMRLYPPPGRPADWIRNAPWAAYPLVETSDGTLIVTLAFARAGQADEQTWPRLREAEWATPEPGRFYFGRTVCFGGRVPDVEAAAREAEAVLAGSLPLRHADLPGGLWLFDRPGLPDRLALFYADTDEAERLAAAFFNNILPPLALLLHKIARHYMQGYETAQRVALENKEHRLAAVLQQTRTPRQDLSALESQLHELAGAYNDFTGELATFERLQQTLRVNLINLREVFVEHNLPREGPLAARLAAAEKALQQLEADEGFYQAAVRRAQIALAALQAQADVERGQLEEIENRQREEQNRLAERRNLILGLIGVALGALGLAEVVNESVGELLLRWLSLPVSPLTVMTSRLALLLSFGALAGVFTWRWLLRRG